ncbi:MULTISPECIES: ArsA-related P-loop ATPase [unclassified Streptomyces]|uniref:ArsA family ATPase n=1 Tax=unclassified Streptomyces TaxID=2593676 RepID=UPI000DBA564D|nr:MULTISPECIES: ArsA-related P-loop ATPase [unclassified Streptomyces]MYT70598.1 ArsA family ATPase [Streptomyces sp. SID8367]RAJ90300.1 arsenite efflux ATP-binding protein ArsA [Streptomyces sp. PsTaAH-137]
MRTLFVTGPGGSGTTAVASATALRAARDGARVRLVSGFGGHTAGAVDDLPGVTVTRLTPADDFRADLLALQERAATGLDLLGASRLDGDELTPLPGAGELALLRALRDSAEGPHDLVVVDLPAAPRAVALLALPEQLRRYLRRLLPAERQAARALRPVLGRLAGVPMPAEWLYEAAARWDAELAAAQAVIDADDTSVRLVAEPTEAAAETLRTTVAGLALHGLRLDAVLANRLLPDGSTDPWLADAAARQRKIVAEWQHETYGIAHLGRDARAADLDVPPPAAPAPPVTWPVEDRLADDGVLVWRIPLPGAVREELSLVRRGDELVIGVGAHRRIVPLPSAPRRCTVAGAGLVDGELRVRFAPDPDLWPQAR